MPMGFCSPLTQSSEASKPPQKENNPAFHRSLTDPTSNRSYRKLAKRLRELQLPGRWEGFRSSQRDCSEETPYFDMTFDGRQLSVEEKVEVEQQAENMNPLTFFIDGLSFKQPPTEYKTRASYEAQLMMQHDGSLTWQNPHGQHEGGKVWKLDVKRSNADKLRWICEVDSPGKLPEVFFWRRVPDVPISEVHQHGNNDSCWHGPAKMLRRLLMPSGVTRECNAADAAGLTPSHDTIPNLLGKDRYRSKQTPKSDKAKTVPNLLGADTK